MTFGSDSPYGVGNEHTACKLSAGSWKSMVHSLVCELYQLSVCVCNIANVYVSSVVIPKGCVF